MDYSIKKLHKNVRITKPSVVVEKEKAVPSEVKVAVKKKTFGFMQREPNRKQRNKNHDLTIVGEDSIEESFAQEEIKEET